MRSIGVVTVGRSDYGIYRSLLEHLSGDSRFELRLYVSGAHLSPEFGLTVREIERDGFAISERVEMLVSGDTPESVAKSMGLGLIGFSQAFARNRPDLLFVLGDRFEMFAATAAALPFNIPVAHIHGGEITMGAIDESFRHAISKMSHLHFVATEEYRRRVIQLGEDPERVTVCGAPALDGLEGFTPMSRAELESAFGISLETAPLLVTFHPLTTEFEEASIQTGVLLEALSETGLPVVFTAPNADVAGRVTRNGILEFTQRHDNARFVENFGRKAYFSMMRHSLAMVGNSSSGIVEAASFGLPVVNIGSRQTGRTRGANVIDVPCEPAAIRDAIRNAVSPEFRKSLSSLANPYRPLNQNAADIIIGHISEIPDVRAVIAKRFRDLTTP